MKSNQNVIVSSFFWKMLERVGTQGIQLAIQIVLARLLLPKDYGIITLVTIFITMATVLVQSGLNTALIQKKDSDEKDFSTVFWISIVLAVMLYICMFEISPLIAWFYGEETITGVLRVLSIVLFFHAINSVQNAYVVKNMLFKKLFKCTLISTLISGSLGIIMAYAGKGVWSLVIYQLCSSALNCLIMWYSVNWRPKFIFDLERAKVLWKYGWKIMAAYFLDTFYREIQGLVLGKISDTSTLGYYNRGQQIPAIVIRCSNDTIKSVILPIYSERQENRDGLKVMMRKTLSMVAFIIFPIMAGLAMVAPEMTEVLLTEKWLPSVPFARILCLAYFMQPLISVHMQAINAIGRSDIFCKTVYIQLGISFMVLCITVKIGVYAVAYGIVLATIIQWIMYIYETKKLFFYNIKELFEDIVGSVLITLFMMIGVAFADMIEMQIYLKLFFKILLGMIIYIGMAFLFKPRAYRYIELILKEKRTNSEE
ncbi:lipopolysaccharide biosynthesis protein [Lachnospiraceae bacterium 29-91]